MNTPEQILNFLTSGRAVLTATSEGTGKHFTYKVVQTPNDDGSFFVSVLTGPNNVEDYSYIGMLRLRPDEAERTRFIFHATKGSTVAREALCFASFAWIVRRLDHGHLPEGAKLDHMGECGRCGRPLTTPESIELGLGPVCATKRVT